MKCSICLKRDAVSATTLKMDNVYYAICPICKAEFYNPPKEVA